MAGARHGVAMRREGTAQTASHGAAVAERFTAMAKRPEATQRISGMAVAERSIGMSGDGNASAA